MIYFAIGTLVLFIFFFLCLIRIAGQSDKRMEEFKDE